MPTVPVKFVRTLALSAILVLIGNPIADRLGLKYWLAGINEASVRVFAYTRTGTPADIVVLGSSRSVGGVIPRLIEEEYRRATGMEISVYNLAMAGARITNSAIVLRDTIETNGCPAIVLLELGPRTLDSGSGFPNTVLEYHASLSDTVAALPEIRSTETFDAAGWGLLRGYLNLVLWVSHRPWSDPWEGIFALWQSRGGSPYSYPDIHQTVETMMDWSSMERARNLRRTPIGKRTVESPDFVFDSFTMKALDKVLASAGQCGSRVVVWTPPAILDYKKLFRSSETERFDAVLSGLSGRQDVEVFDVGDGRLGLSDADFEDFTHLNSRGAVALTRALARRIAEARPIETD